MASAEFVRWLKYANQIEYAYEYGIITKAEYDEVYLTYDEWQDEPEENKKDLTSVL